MQKSVEMRPTRRTKFIRQCKIYQFVRFLSIIVRVMKVALFPPKH